MGINRFAYPGYACCFGGADRIVGSFAAAGRPFTLAANPPYDRLAAE